MLYAPPVLVVVSVTTLVWAFRAETFALATAPPCASVTAPVTMAPDTCARSGSDSDKLMLRTHPKSRSWPSFPFMNTPPVWSYLRPNYVFPPNSDPATRNLEKRTGERGYMEKIVSGGMITQQRTAF